MSRSRSRARRAPMSMSISALLRCGGMIRGRGGAWRVAGARVGGGAGRRGGVRAGDLGEELLEIRGRVELDLDPGPGDLRERQPQALRSEERRGGEESRARWPREYEKGR